MRSLVIVSILVLSACATAPSGVDKTKWRTAFDSCYQFAQQEQKRESTQAGRVASAATMMFVPWFMLPRGNPASPMWLEDKINECMVGKDYPPPF